MGAETWDFIVVGAGQVFSAQAAYDSRSGQLLRGSFVDDAMPRAGIV